VSAALIPLGVPVVNDIAGPFWGQGMERCIERAIKAFDSPEIILTIDQDGMFTVEHVKELARLMVEHPEADAIAALEYSRNRNAPLLTIKDQETGEPMRNIPLRCFDPELTKLASAHFGLTMLRTSALAKLPKPWFHSTPDPDGSWHDGRIDDDIHFWQQWDAAGCSLYSANHVVVGHIERMIVWPDSQFQPRYQYVHEWHANGAPPEVWQ